MICPQCGKEFADNLTSCPYCVAGSSPTGSTPEAGYGKKKRPSHAGRPILIFALIIVAVAIVGALLLTRSASNVQIETLVPESAGMVAVSDANWWWNATADVRANADVQKAMKEGEKRLGISFEKDVVPWMGEMGFVMVGMSQTQPKFAILGEIKDESSFRRFVDKARNAATREGHVGWTETNYHGVKLQETEFSTPAQPNPFSNRSNPFGGSYAPPKTHVSVGMLGKWFVIGVGKGSAESIIDTWQHRTLSIARSAKWSKALAEFHKMPGKHVAWFGYDGESYMKIAWSSNPMIGGMLQVPDACKVTTISAFTESSNELKLESVTVPNSEKARAFYQSFAQSKPVTGKSIDQLPDGTFAAIVSTASWEKQIDYMKQMIDDMFSNPQMKSAIDMQIMRAQPVLEVLKSFDGESAAALTWKDGSGFGAVVLGETAGPQSAKAAAGDLQSFAQVSGAPVKVANGMAQLPKAKYDTKNLHLLLCWGAKNEWLKFGSHPNWLAAKPAKAKLQLPAEAKNAACVGVGDFRFLPSVLKWAKSESKTKDEKEAIDLIGKLGLDKAQWAMWTQADGQTGVVHGTIVLRNFEWRKATRTVMDFADKHK